MKDNNNGQVEIKIIVFSEILKQAKSISLKSESMIRDHYMGSFLLADFDLGNVMDVKVSSKVLISRLEELIDQTVEAKVDSVFLPPAEVKMIANLIAAISAAGKSEFANTNMREH